MGSDHNSALPAQLFTTGNGSQWIIGSPWCLENIALKSPIRQQGFDRLQCVDFDELGIDELFLPEVLSDESFRNLKSSDKPTLHSSDYRNDLCAECPFQDEVDSRSQPPQTRL